MQRETSIIQVLVGKVTEVRWNRSWNKPLEGIEVSRSYKHSGQIRTNNKGIRWDGKIKSCLSILLLCIINVNKTPGARVLMGRGSQARERSLPANTALLIATWEPAIGSLPQGTAARYSQSMGTTGLLMHLPPAQEEAPTLHSSLASLSPPSFYSKPNLQWEMDNSPTSLSKHTCWISVALWPRQRLWGLKSHAPS